MCPFSAIHMETGDTANTIDQAATVGSRTHRARRDRNCGRPLPRRRQQLLKLASAQPGSAGVEKLTVSDGVVSVVGNLPRKFLTAT